jgi:hypothetical protein
VPRIASRPYGRYVHAAATHVVERVRCQPCGDAPPLGGFALQKSAQNPSTSNIENVLKDFQSQIKGQWGS